MSEHKPLYEWSLNTALEHGERDLWRESYRENCDCARAIERAIRDNYRDNRLEDCAKSLIDEYGFARVNWVLANTLQQKDYDGRFSTANKQWAQRFYIPKDDVRWHFTVESHPGLTDLFVDQARKAWQELGLFDASHCLPDDNQQDYTGRVVVIDPNIFKDEYKTPEDQLFLAEGGFGARPNSRGTKVFGTLLKDGSKTHYRREDIIGVLKEDLLPEWAQDKLAEIGGIILGILIIIFLPVAAILSIFNGNIVIDEARLQEIVVANMSAEQVQRLQAVENTMYAIDDSMTAAGFGDQRVREAQVLYVLALSDCSEQSSFVATLTGCFADEQSDADLIAAVNSAFGKSIPAAEFTQVMSAIRASYISTSGYIDPNTKNNYDLVQWAKHAYSKHWGYVWGTYGKVLTKGLYNAKLEQYPDEVGQYSEWIESHWIGGRTADCVGFIKGYSWFNPDTHEIGYAINGMPDIGADSMYYNATEKGTIDTIPEIPGLAVWHEGHIGIYIGGGQVIHASGTIAGVVQTPIGNSGWTHWLKIPYITYIEANVPTAVNEERIWEVLYAKIGNPYGVAGLMGNLFAESGLHPNNLQDDYEGPLGYTDATYTMAVDSGSYANFKTDSAGYGLAQWTVENRKTRLLNFATARGTSIADLDMQLDFLCQELETGFPGVFNALKNATSVREASDYVLINFEAPLHQDESVKVERASYGTAYYVRYGQ